MYANALLGLYVSLLFSRSKSHQRNLAWMLAGFYKRNVNKSPHVLCTMRWVSSFLLSRLKEMVISRWERSLLRMWYAPPLSHLPRAIGLDHVFVSLVRWQSSADMRKRELRVQRTLRYRCSANLRPRRLTFSVIDRTSLEIYFLWYTPFWFSFSCKGTQCRSYRTKLVLLCAQIRARCSIVIAFDI